MEFGGPELPCLARQTLSAFHHLAHFWRIRTPPRSLEQDAQLVARPADALEVVPHRTVLVEGDGQGTVRADVLRQAVADAFALVREAPEQPVPDDQDAAVVAVEV